jgi:NCAIR mutase (PurE)-related protein
VSRGRGMEGPAIRGGRLVDVPVIAVLPAWGMALLSGLAALLAMLNSCSSGVGRQYRQVWAGFLACLILRGGGVGVSK